VDNPFGDSSDMRNMLTGGRKPEDVEMDITPMIDITFLLLIFFIVAAKIENQGGVTLPHAEYAQSVLQYEAVVITLTKNGDGSAAIYLGDNINEDALVKKASPEAREEAVRQYVDTELATDEKKKTVLLKADAELKHREVDKMLRALAGVDADLSVMHVAVLKD